MPLQTKTDAAKAAGDIGFAYDEEDTVGKAAPSVDNRESVDDKAACWNGRRRNAIRDMGRTAADSFSREKDDEEGNDEPEGDDEDDEQDNCDLDVGVAEEEEIRPAADFSRKLHWRRPPIPTPLPKTTLLPTTTTTPLAIVAPTLLRRFCKTRDEGRTFHSPLL